MPISFGSLLRKGVAFGRSLGRDAKTFGRSVTHIAHKVSSGIGKAENYVSKLEKPWHNVPVVGVGLQTVGGVLHGARNVADIAATGGQALTDVARGDFGGARRDALTAKGQIGDLVSGAGSTIKSAGVTAAQAAPYIAQAAPLFL